MSEREEAPARRDEPLPEGEERAPPGTRTMALVRWAIVALMAALAAGSWIYLAADAGGTGDDSRWQCPMHPRIATAHRGECPICGMDLVPVAAASAGTPARAAPADGGFLCPMHLQVGSADPEARCPDCGMKLWERERALAWARQHEPLPDSTESAAGVPGLAPVEIAADRVQLSGMRTAVAARETLAPVIRTAGFVAASETAVVSVTTRFAGWVETLGSAQTGQLVRKGDVLATLYSPDLAAVQQAYLNALRWTEGPTATGRPSSVTDLERDARARLEQLGVSPEDVALLASTGKPLREVSVRAPARGHITRRTAVRGLYVAPGTELFQIADLGTVWVLADVYESEIGRVRVGQAAAFETTAWPGERFTGKVAFVSPALSTSPTFWLVERSSFEAASVTDRIAFATLAAMGTT